MTGAAVVTSPSAPGQETVPRLWGCLDSYPEVCLVAASIPVFILLCVGLCLVVKVLAPKEKFVDH